MIGQTVTLGWWAHTIRDHGGVLFVDLRDRYGITQIKADPATTDASLLQTINAIKDEYVIKVTGEVAARPEWTINSDLATGEIEVIPTSVEILSASKPLPFQISQENAVGEEIRMEHRYLDLRRERMKDNIMARSTLTMATFEFFRDEGFVYVETPSLIKNTPEWAREYIVPDRRRSWSGYVLPQSPQQLKQMLMVAGYDRYVQLARCFRDEDLRGDRQPEFTQIDLEMSFVEQEDVLQLMERYYRHLFAFYPHKMIQNDTFRRMTYDEAMSIYGIDKPEWRTEKLTITDVSEIAAQSDMKVFGDIVASGGVVIGMVSDKLYSRGEIDKFTTRLQEKGAKWLAYIVWGENGPTSPILKFFSEEQQQALLTQLWLTEGKVAFFQAWDWQPAHELLGYLRTILIEEQWLVTNKQDELACGFVTDFPMFEVDEETWGIAAVHHPFTKPKDEDIPYVLELAKMIEWWHTLTSDERTAVMAIKSDAYDVVVSGYEAAGGSIRIHDATLQKAIFTIFGLSEQEIEARFGHMLRAFSYGVPPHGGCAVGFDRTVMILQDEPNIREVIAFPKTQKGEDLLLGAPSAIDEKLYDELHLRVVGWEEE